MGISYINDESPPSAEYPIQGTCSQHVYKKTMTFLTENLTTPVNMYTPHTRCGLFFFLIVYSLLVEAEMVSENSTEYKNTIQIS